VVDCRPQLKLCEVVLLLGILTTCFSTVEKPVCILQLCLLQREETGEGVLSDGPSLPTIVCGREGRMSHRNHMEIAVSLRIFLNKLGHKCLEEVEILVLRRLSFPPLTCLFPEVSAETPR